jgi:hypothetical protein
VRRNLARAMTRHEIVNSVKRSIPPPPLFGGTVSNTVAVAEAPCAYASCTVIAKVAVPALLDAVPKFAVHVSVVLPQPDVIAKPVTLLVVGVTTSDPVPVKVNITGAIAELTTTLCEAPDVNEMVGAAGFVTTIATGIENERFAPSFAVTWMFAVPNDPTTGVTVSVQAAVGFPQVDGDIATVAEPLEVKFTVDAAETANTPVPPTVNGIIAGAPPPTIEVP